MADFDPGTGLGPRLRLVRGSRQLSVRELARRVGCSASLISLGYNLIQHTDGCAIGGNTAGNLLGYDPMLLPLTNSLGWTHPLHALSPAVDAGNPSNAQPANACPAIDQRGRPRPIDGELDGAPICDIGAYELQTPTHIRRMRLPLVLR